MEEPKQTMRAMVTRSYGDLSKTLELVEDWPVPTPAQNQVLIKIHSASVNPVDWKLLATSSPFSPSLPHIPLHDFSGTIAALGEGSNKFKIGDAVYGYFLATQDGDLCEYKALPENVVFPKPENISFEEAAAISLVGCTAYQALFTKGNLKEGDKVFINGGSTACGLLAIQMAKTLGCHVVATCSDRTREMVASFGADLINYKTEKWDDVLQNGDFTFVFDTIGDAWEPAQKILRQTSDSRVISIATPPGQMDTLKAAKFGIDFASRKIWSLFGSPDYVFLLLDVNIPTMEILSEQIKAGKLKIIIDSVHEFEQSKEAIAKSKEGSALGKVVIRVQKEEKQ